MTFLIRDKNGKQLGGVMDEATAFDTARRYALSGGVVFVERELYNSDGELVTTAAVQVGAETEQ
jgi:hypothetical protein